ncbi:MAG: hypothetical protein M2R45_02003 [Verrucomicrobia subdivision 3 bacterium]|nr:hypothetical protein [Limisphaerales bacterium]MCS1414821.1 hypothetical protein [Limisphaerales bacterium]
MPGSKIVLHEVLYFEGALFVSRSGALSHPIVIENAPGAIPILDGIHR